MMVPVLALVVGLAILAFASDQFVVGAARVALVLRVAPLVVGVVIVGFGTSAPELLVSVLAAAGGEPEVSIGNVVGSNIVNLTLLLGVGALLTPLVVESRVVRREAPIVVAATIVYAVLAQGGFVRWEGGVLLVAMAVALVLVFQSSRPTDPLGSETTEFAEEPGHRLRPEVIRTLLGLVGTVAGAQTLLWGALSIANDLELDSGFVGATLVAIGTSLPELVTVVQSARHRETDLIVGNLLGSNLFNVLAVGGAAALVGPAVVDAPNLTVVAVVAALIIAVVVWALMRTGYRISRIEGAVLVVAYAVTVPLLT